MKRIYRYVNHVCTALAIITVFDFSLTSAIAQPADTATSTTAPISARQPVRLNLDAINAKLVNEKPGVNGLRQKVLYKEGLTTVILLSFDEGGKKASHTAPGTATIHVVEGEMDIRVLGKNHNLTAGQLLVLQPGVTHDLTAKKKSQVLVTIHRTGHQ